MAHSPTLHAPIAHEIWSLKYRLRSPDGIAIEQSLDDTLRRVAKAAAGVEATDQAGWEARFHAAMADLGFIPAGRILAGAGAERRVTLFNCFVMGTVPDDLSGIFEAVKQSALTMQMGGGIGVDFSTLRPKGAPVASIGADASGPVSFMEVWDSMCRTIMSAGARRGAMMAVLRADHPDIEEFVDAKGAMGRLTNFNLSVLATDAFMDAVRGDQPWPLRFEGNVFRTIRARDLWQRIMRATYDTAEPGVVFIDRINQRNNLSYCETISATNPCGEQPLPPHGACLLGSLNLTRFVEAPFTAASRLDTDALGERARIAVRLLDNMIDASLFPLPEQRAEALAKRRIGLGVTGLADALVMCGARYGEPRALELAGSWMAAIQRAAYAASAGLAAEKGSFPLCDTEALLARPNLVRLEDGVRDQIRQHGLRNGCLTSIAPTGTLSLLAGNVSSGIEPIFDLTYRRKVLAAGGEARDEIVEDYAYALFRATTAHDTSVALPEAFVTAAEVTVRGHLEMQAAVQQHVDSAISKTINCPADMPFEDFAGIYELAHALGLKGCTTYRPTPLRGSVLSPVAAADTLEPRLAAPVEVGQVSTTQRSAKPGDVVYMAKPLERAAVLQGATYKLKWPDSDHALYVTINDIEHDGRRRPFEMFINTKNLEHFAWTVALTRMISAVFRRGGDVSFVAEELKAVFDPQGGSWIGGRYVPSLLAAIGEVIETHLHKTGFTPEGHPLDEAAPVRMVQTEAAARRREAGGIGLGGGATGGGGPVRQCPRCGSARYVRQEGCFTCQSCGFSRCD
ncbi:MAG: adenosylcobalamin-dependent ribonucleoside-diphosphate reductase [Hyphomicrobiaceae bacterium]|nr:adenosylcobalamin-dependent ribonucleoside-diphosphate reductase [Hyphomicrobiaceae bacterium]